MSHPSKTFSKQASETLYEIIFNRRDVRGEFNNKPIADEVLARLLIAAHHAPSVGFMQPWNFLLIQQETQRTAVHKLFQTANEEAKQQFDSERQNLYQSLKLEGLLTSPLHICVTCDRNRAGPVVLGRTHMHDTDLYSTVCAVQNFWLAARAENIGVGWVSIFHEAELKKLLKIPEEIHIIAYLTVGHVNSFHQTPDLARKGWRNRLNLNDLVMHNEWNNHKNNNLSDHIQSQLERLNPDPKNPENKS